MKYEYELITPERAREILEHVKINRPLRGDRVKAYARDMRNGRWREVAGTICIDRNEDLIDGQHRLAAIVESGVDIPLMVITGLEPEDQLVIDAGAARRSADVFVLAGHKYGVRLSALTRLGLSIEMERPYDNSLRLTNQELFDFLERNPGLTQSVVDSDNFYKQAHITPTNAAMVMFYGGVKIPNTTWKFFTDLASGVGLAATDPALILRNRMLPASDETKKPTRLAQLYLILKSLVLTKESVLGISKLQLPRGSKVDATDVNALIGKLKGFRDEREND